MPSVPPMDGTYNIPPASDEPYPSYQSVSKLPPNQEFPREARAIASKLRIVVDTFLSERNYPRYNEILAEVFGEYAVGEFPSDRTMCFFVGDLDVFTPQFIALLQREVLSEFPLWRLLAQFEERSIGVYPNAAWLGKTLVEGEFDASNSAYVAWFEEAKASRDRIFGPVARQLRFVKKQLPDAMHRARSNRFCFLGAFDRYQSHLEGIPVWILHDGAVELSFDPEYAPIRNSAVSDSAEIYPEFCELFYPKTDITPPFWLVTQLLKDNNQRHLIVTDTEGLEVGQIQWSEIIRDDDLSRSGE